MLGIGNVLMGDEAVGVHVARAFDAARRAPRAADSAISSEVTVVDGGTGGFHLLSCLTDYDPVIVIDATTDGRPPGTVSVTQPKYPADFPRTLTAHDIGLRDLVECAALVQGLPSMFLVTVSIDAIQPMETRLTPAVASAIPEALDAVGRLLQGEGT